MTSVRLASSMLPAEFLAALLESSRRAARESDVAGEEVRKLGPKWLSAPLSAGARRLKRDASASQVGAAAPGIPPCRYWVRGKI